MSDVTITIGQSLDTIGADVADAMRRAVAGENVPPLTSVNFASWEQLAAVLTTRRLELLRHLHRTPARSIRALAATLKRDYATVHSDVKALAAAGLIERDDAGLHADYDAIDARIAL